MIPLALSPSTALIVSVLPVLKMTSSLPAPGTIVPCPAVMLSEEEAAALPMRIPPVEIVSVLPAVMTKFAAVVATLRKLAIVWLVQAVVFVTWKSTFAAAPGAVVAAIEAV